MLDEITQAVLAREEVVEYLQGGHGERGQVARERIYAYLDELRTTQRYSIYRALKHPLYPILRKIERIAREPRSTSSRPRRAAAASSTRRITRATPTIWSSRWCSTTTACARRSSPPASTCSAARSACIHRHVTGAIPIRRNTKDPAYLITLKAYVAEMLRKHDLFFYPEGGRSYSGELKIAEDRADARRAAGRASRAGRSFRPRSPTTWCSRTTCSRASA